MKKTRALQWRRTWKNEPDDYHGSDPEVPRAYCRVYYSVGMPGGSKCRWFAAGPDVNIASGVTLTVEEAVEASEAAYLDWKINRTAT